MMAACNSSGTTAPTELTEVAVDAASPMCLAPSWAWYSLLSAEKWTQRGADLGAPDTTLESQLAQWILDLDVQQVIEFVGGVAGFGVGDQNGTGVDQGAVAGEADLVVGPQSELVEASDLVESVVLATVGITRQIAERAQLAEHGHGDLGTEGRLEFLQGEDGVCAEQ